MNLRKPRRVINIEHTCRMCEISRPNSFSFTMHLLYGHKIKAREYYIKYILNNDEPFCKCGGSLRFYGMDHGFGGFCSYTCSNKFHKNTKEFKEKLSERNIINWQSSEYRRNMKCSWGIRVYYKNNAMRSSYEVSFAKWCDVNKIKWIYEPQAFKISYNEGKHGSHFPDFYLPELELFVEVKSYCTFDKIKDPQKAKDIVNRGFQYIMIKEDNWDSGLELIKLSLDGNGDIFNYAIKTLELSEREKRLSCFL